MKTLIFCVAVLCHIFILKKEKIKYKLVKSLPSLGKSHTVEMLFLGDIISDANMCKWRNKSQSKIFTQHFLGWRAYCFCMFLSRKWKASALPKQTPWVSMGISLLLSPHCNTTTTESVCPETMGKLSWWDDPVCAWQVGCPFVYSVNHYPTDKVVCS